jgi:hypothetical protein
MSVSAAPAVAASTPQFDLATLFGALPAGLRKELLGEFNKVVRNFREGRWEPAELDGGKLCEVVYSIVRGLVDGKYPAQAAKPRNMEAACAAFVHAPTTFPRSVRLQIPRTLITLYGVRNDRSVGHVGGDVDPNHMDASLVIAMVKWLVAELVRIFHGVDTATAAAYVEALVDREVPLVWRFAGTRRVLDPTLSKLNKVLLLLYSEAGPVSLTDLGSWLGLTELRYLKRDTLRPAARKMLLHFDEATALVYLSPTGTRLVETGLAGPLSGVVASVAG